MKTISKKKLDEVINLTRNYWGSARETGKPNESLLAARIKVAAEIEHESTISEFSLLDLVDSILRWHGFIPDAENEDIHFVLRAMGWRVKDEVQESESL